MSKLPKSFIILELIPSSRINGDLIEVNALRISDKKIIDRLNIRLDRDKVLNPDLLDMTSYDKENFQYFDSKDKIEKELKSFVKRTPIYHIFDGYTNNYLEYLSNKKHDILEVLNMKYHFDIIDEIINKYKIEPTKYLVDIFYEAMIFNEDK